jgi:diguanylate cyclase (GGDEF)-like protein/PAS domain S-box-containing protein
MAEISPSLSTADLTAALRESEQRWSFALEGSGDGVWDWDIPANTMFYSPAYLKILGYEPDEGIASVEDFGTRIHPDDRTEVLDNTVQLLRGDIPIFSREFRLHCKDDSYKWVLSRGKVIHRTADGQPERVIGTISDISSRKEAEVELHLAAEVFARCAEAILITDRDNRIISVNRAFTEITGYLPEDVIGQNPRILSSGRQNPTFYQTMWATLQTSGHWRGEIWNRRKNGRIYPEWLSISMVREPSGQVSRYIAIFTDISDSKQAAERIHYLSTHDALTGLANLAQLEDALEQAVVKAQDQHDHIALISLSLNHLRQTNEKLGHAAGDQLLKQTAERLQQLVHDGSIVSRQNGEQFHILLHGTDISETRRIAQSIIETLSHFQLLGDKELEVQPCLGISLYPEHGKDAASLLESADVAMFHLIESGRHGMQFYSAEMNAGALQQMTLENSLRQALEQEEFHIHYQPLYDLKTNRMIGAEALLRWKHPEMDMVSPTLFIELAEESGVIIPIGEWMMTRICRQLQAWQTAGLRTVPISVNFTPQQFKQPDLAQQIEDLLKENNINPFFLEIEITENTLTENLSAADQIIRKLKKSGIRVNVDDFGTGHSSLAHLKRFHIDKLKIDPSFIANLLDDADDSAIVRGMISMAHSMRMEVVAEGVETQKQLDFLKALNCDQIQGFFYSAALPADAFTKLLEGTESAA